MYYCGFEKRPNAVREIIFPSCQKMSAVNHMTVARVFSEAMQTLWPDGVKFDSVLLLFTDAAPYMKKAAEELKSATQN
jgi:hypothetical protein